MMEMPFPSRSLEIKSSLITNQHHKERSPLSSILTAKILWSAATEFTELKMRNSEYYTYN